MREFFVARVARDECEGSGGAAVLFRAQNSPKSLSFLLAGTERARNLDENVGLGQVYGEISDFGQHDAPQRPAAEAVVDRLSLRLRCCRSAATICPALKPRARAFQIESGVIRMNVFRTLYQLSERRDCGAGI